MQEIVPKIFAYPMAAICGGLGAFMLLRPMGPNMWIGVRLPWTFADRRIWDKSWRLAAIFLLGMGGGILISWKLFWIAVAHLIILSILYPVWLYRRNYGTLRFWKDIGWTDYYPVARCAHCGYYQKLPDAAAWAGLNCEACGHPLERQP